MTARALWLVRHGPTHQKVMTGWRDVPADLSDTAALARLDAALPRPATLLSSDLVRATATADALAPGRHRLPHDPALREIDFGLWDGMAFDAVAQRDPDLSRAFWERPGDIAAPGGESWDRAATRVSAAIDAALAAHDGPLIIVAHIGAILTQVARATGHTPYATLAQDIRPLSRTCIEVSGQADAAIWRLREVNVTA